jgi:tRNA threonylcarbamoyl adenosine modification protein YeaZ
MDKNDQTPVVHILGIETSGPVSGVYLSEEDRLIGSSVLNLKNIHSRQLASMIDQLLNNLSLTYQNLSHVAISAGPGSFTGLRIGYSLMKGLVQALEIPVIEIPTLDIWAFQHGATDLPVLSVIDAYRNEIFCSFYRWQNGCMLSEGKPEVLPIEELQARLAGPTVLVGGDLVRLSEKIVQLKLEAVKMQFPVKTEPEPAALLSLAYMKILNREFGNTERCEPIYMRPFKGIM